MDLVRPTTTRRESQADEKRSIKKAEKDEAKRAKAAENEPPAPSQTRPTKRIQEILEGDKVETSMKDSSIGRKRKRSGSNTPKKKKKGGKIHKSKKHKDAKEEAKEDKGSAAREYVTQPKLEDQALPVKETPSIRKPLKFSINHEGSIKQYLFRAPSPWYGGPGSKNFKYKDDDTKERAYEECKEHLRAMCEEYDIDVPQRYAE